MFCAGELASSVTIYYVESKAKAGKFIYLLEFIVCSLRPVPILQDRLLMITMSWMPVYIKTYIHRYQNFY